MSLIMAHFSRHSPVLMLYVSVAHGDDTAPGTLAQPFCTISHALQQAIAGTIISVAPGRYATASGEQFPLVVPADVMLMGDGTFSPSPPETEANLVLIEGGGFFFSPTAGYQTVTLVPSHRSVVQGVVISNGEPQGTGVWVESAKTILRYCRVHRCQREGMVVTTGGSPLVQDCQFAANRLSEIIFLADAAGTVERTSIRQTDDLPPDGYGIAIRDQATPTLRHNQVTGHQVGMAIAGTATPRLTGNHIRHNRDGLVVMETARPHLGTESQPGNNAIASNQRYDIHIRTSHAIPLSGNYLAAAKIQGRGVVSHPLTPAPAPPSPGAPAAPFPDSIGHWARPFIEALHQQEVIQGFPDGAFHPDESLTRAQYAALLTKLFDLPQVAEAIAFRDVKDSFWAAAAIQKASEMGFIAGFPDGTVRPDRELTRVQAIVSLVNGLRLTGGIAKDLEYYGDRATIPAYAKDEVATATHKYLVVNHPDVAQLNPNYPITRAEMAVLLYQVQVITGQVGAIASPFLVIPPPIPVSFKDVQDTGKFAELPASHWAANFIEGLAGQRLIRGITSNEFAPEKAMSRAEFAVLLVQLFNPLPHKTPRGFIDVPSRHWAASAIQRVTQAGLMAGFGDGSFQPQLDIKRWQLLVAVVKALALPARNPSQLDRYYYDLDSVPTEALGAIAIATQHNLVVNYPNLRRIDGNRGATRAEVAATLYQSLVLTHRLPTLLSPYIVPPLLTPPVPGKNEERRTKNEDEKNEESPHSPTPPLPHSPTPSSSLLLPTVILSPVTPIYPIADIEQYLFGHSNQAHLIAQTITAQLQQQGITAVTYHPQMRTILLKHAIPTDSDLLVRLQVLDQPVAVADATHSPSATPSIDEIAWQVALLFNPASPSSQVLAETLHRRILDEVGLGDRGLQVVTDLWPDVNSTAENTELPAPSLAVWVSLSPVQTPADDYPPIPMSGLVRVLVSEIGDRLVR
ncbi:MAG: DUF1565 domain-containing protein [Cyanothece sp. SIO2G6]|nr:DUF1565 domain-containing protein [Cyanothece sp. SIO2G6]